jgi:hypothetical protein
VAAPFGAPPAGSAWNNLSNPLAEPNQNEIVLLGMRQNVAASLALSSDSGGPYYVAYYLANHEMKTLKGKLDASLLYDAPVPCPPGTGSGFADPLTGLRGLLGGLIPIPCYRRVSFSVFNYNSPGISISSPPWQDWGNSIKSYLHTNY